MTKPEIQCKLLLLNGPPSSGKDTVAKAIKNYGKAKGLDVSNVVIKKLAGPIKSAYPSLLGKTNSEELDLLKDEEYLGVPRGIRKLQIALSEDVMKPLFGKDIFAQLLTQSVRCLKKEVLCIISDCGFTNEYRYLFYRTPRNNFLTLRLHRGNTSFEGDSREYIKGDGDYKTNRIIDVNNDENIRESIDGYIDLIARNLNINYDVTKIDINKLINFQLRNRDGNLSPDNRS